jgi:hypothetical protein
MVGLDAFSAFPKLSAEYEEGHLIIIEIEDLSVELIRKNIKNVHLRIYPPEGRIVVSAPVLMRDRDVRKFIESKLSWIKKQQKKFEALEREVEREFVDGESHYYLGKEYRLKIAESGRKQGVSFDGDCILLSIRSGADRQKRSELLYAWYRQRLKEEVPVIISRHEEQMKVQVSGFGIKRMKTRWGTCNTGTGRIWINLELAKRSPESLEYLVVHEMCHLLERRHDKRFKSFMDRYLPDWRIYKEELSRFPLCNSDLYS